MRALTLHRPEDIHFESVPDPEILDPGDVIVQVTDTAICGSDLHVYFGREKVLMPVRPWDMSLPALL